MNQKHPSWISGIGCCIAAFIIGGVFLTALMAGDRYHPSNEVITWFIGGGVMAILCVLISLLDD